jgi:enolase
MPAVRIQSVKARQLIDCNCRPMVEVDVITDNGVIGRGCAPTGSSVGKHEAYVLRDNDPKEYHGLSVHRAVENVQKVLAPALIGMNIEDQRAIDERLIALDGTHNKEHLGGNAIYAVSIACIEAAAAYCGQPLYRYLAGGDIKTVPVPSFNVINGGRYESFTQSFNEFIIMPYRAESIYEAVEIGVNIFQELRTVISKHTGSEPKVASSYGYAAPSDDPEVCLSLMQEAINRCGCSDKVAFCLDCASSEMFDSATNTYLLKGKRVTSDELIAYAKRLTERFNFVFIEDLLDEDDWDGYPKALKELPRTIIIGDDLIVTNKRRLERACKLKAVDGFILKPNQVGTITEALDTYTFATSHNLIGVPSGRSGGVVRDVVMDFAVGLQVPFQKNGAPRSGERIDKLNFLMRVSDLSAGCELADVTKLVRF